MLNNSANVIMPTFQGYHTNNVYDNFPPLMADGRAITSNYTPNAVLNEMLIKEIGIQSNWQYRRYLTANANDIMKYDYIESANDIGYTNRFKDSSLPFSTPYTYSSFIDTKKTKGFEDSDMKSLYLSREQLEARKVAPVITQSELLQYSTR